jgi:enoyl-CoA hydratase/carnithine racemase
MSEFQFPVTREGAVVRIDLGRPDEGNALTRGMMPQLSGLLRDHGRDESVNVIVLAARGPHFCRGRDGKGESKAGMTPWEVRTKLMGATLDIFQAIADVPVPVVARVQGNAFGFGAGLAVACDVTLASDASRFAFPEIEHDIPPTMAICATRGKVHPKAMSYLVYSAEQIDAREAVTFGLVSRFFPQSSFEADADAFITKLASRPRLIVETIKRYQSKVGQLSPDMASEYAGTLLALVRP